MSNPQDNVLLLALANDELDKFLVGEPFYFLEAKTDNDEPQNVVAAFDQLIMPHWRQTHDATFPPRFVAALLTMLATYPDRTRAIYIAADWVWYYRFCQDKQRQQPLGPYGDLFDVDMGSVAVALKRLLENHKAELVADTRWAGAAWNSPDGMWTPLMRSAVMVRDKLGGPDFVPGNI
ncbi:hypothetical protein HU762_03585 [Pseudomonas sp. SWRI92]|uniref:Uncharacterized protein n=1 Tax=Pseudomonas marvdashtae TaxID=2745500 RepID=A0A923JSU0_9PSED|nr:MULTISPECIES: hypothetical protein [Pseudomonas]MBC3373015.1 hypothetical protein [Pseudomonas sp. SWRI92]MBV4554092.1 hypothetical protein [Pseudomonas marvdashtae]